MDQNYQTFFTNLNFFIFSYIQSDELKAHTRTAPPRGIQQGFTVISGPYPGYSAGIYSDIRCLSGALLMDILKDLHFIFKKKKIQHFLA